jgi:hypothetical protein
MTKRPGPTPIQDIALNLAFAVVGEHRFNRTPQEYAAIASKLPELKVLAFKINKLLQELWRCNCCNGIRLPQLCRFKAGDERYVYEEYPRKISYETLRAALRISGLLALRRHKA